MYNSNKQNNNAVSKKKAKNDFKFYYICIINNEIRLMKKEIFYVSNLISLSRFLLLIPTIILLLRENYSFSVLFIILIWISDLLDGYTARKRHEISEFGKIIDPLADKICIAAIAIVMMLKGILPLWFVSMAIFRDLIILFGGLYLKSRKNIVLQSNRLGKIAVFSIGFTLILFLASAISTESAKLYPIEFLELLRSIFIFISIVMSFISLVAYMRRFIQNIK